MSLYFLCSYFSVLCCCGCWNSIFFHDAKIRFFSELAKTKSYTGGRKSVSVGEYAMIHTCNSWRPSVPRCSYRILWIPMVDWNSTETGRELTACCHGVGYYLCAGVSALRREDGGRRCGYLWLNVQSRVGQGWLAAAHSSGFAPRFIGKIWIIRRWNMKNEKRFFGTAERFSHQSVRPGSRRGR